MPAPPSISTASTRPSPVCSATAPMAPPSPAPRRRSQATIHGKPPEEDGGSFLTEDGGIAGGELHARDADGRLVAVSVLDRFDDALSSVYCYYRSEEHTSE